MKQYTCWWVTMQHPSAILYLCSKCYESLPAPPRLLARHIILNLTISSVSTLSSPLSPTEGRLLTMLHKFQTKHQKRREANANERKRIKQLNDAIKRLREATNQSSTR